MFGPEQRSTQVYAQVSGLKRQTLLNAYMVDQEAQADIKLDAELEDERQEREYQVSKQVEQNKVSGQGPDPLSATAGASAITDDPVASPGKDQTKAAQTEKSAQPRKQLKSFMQPIGKTRSRASYARRQMDLQRLRSSSFSVNPAARSGSSTSNHQAP